MLGVGQLPSEFMQSAKEVFKAPHSIRINAQWCLCFIWREDGAHLVEIVDYH
jgi:proteic killer suppression protein